MGGGGPGLGAFSWLGHMRMNPAVLRIIHIQTQAAAIGLPPRQGVQHVFSMCSRAQRQVSPFEAHIMMQVMKYNSGKLSFLGCSCKHGGQVAGRKRAIEYIKVPNTFPRLQGISLDELVPIWEEHADAALYNNIDSWSTPITGFK